MDPDPGRDRPTRPALNRDTTVCISLSGRPSNVGTRLHNSLYDELGLDFVYKAFTTTDLEGAIRGMRALGIRGCGVSMPFKEPVIPLVDELDGSAAAIGSVNTIVNTDGRLVAYNTDFLAIVALLARHRISPDATVAVLGSGGMAKAVVAALSEAGWTSGTVLARNEVTGQALADRYGFRWRRELAAPFPNVIVNATPVGMSGGPFADALPVPREVVDGADVVFDVVAFPPETPLVRLARASGTTVITGAEVVVLQAVEQFVLYTGVRPTEAQVERAAAIALA